LAATSAGRATTISVRCLLRSGHSERGARRLIVGQSGRWRLVARTAGMDPLPDAWEEIGPNGCFDVFTTPGSDPNLPDDVCKCHGGLLIVQLPAAEFCCRLRPGDTLTSACRVGSPAPLSTAGVGETACQTAALPAGGGTWQAVDNAQIRDLDRHQALSHRRLDPYRHLRAPCRRLWPVVRRAVSHHAPWRAPASAHDVPCGVALVPP